MDNELWLVKWSWRDEYKAMLMRSRYHDDYYETQQDVEIRARNMIGHQGGALTVEPLTWGMSHGSGENYRRDNGMVQLDI